MKTLALLCAAGLLAGCAASSGPSGPILAAAPTQSAPVCTRGALDENRTFILCPAGASLEQARNALTRPADPRLDIASLAEDYGVSRQHVTGIKAATYAAIVNRKPEQPSRSVNTDRVTLDGRTFRRIALNATNRSTKTLFIET